MAVIFIFFIFFFCFVQGPSESTKRTFLVAALSQYNNKIKDYHPTEIIQLQSHPPWEPNITIKTLNLTLVSC